MKLRKFVGVALAGMMTLSLATYGESETVETTAAPDTTATVEPSAAAGGTETGATELAPAGGIAKENLKVGFVYIGDENEGYTAVHHAGAMGIRETLSLSDDRIIVKWNIPEDRTAKDAAMDLADQGYQIVSANSLGHESYVIGAAEECPGARFCHTTGFQTTSSGLNNMHNYFTSICGVRYVSGVVAGLKLNQMIEDGAVAKDAYEIGYVDAYPYAGVISGYTSFFLGVRSVCPDTTMEVKCTSSWASFGLEKEAAGTLVPDGYVLINRHADTTGAPTACEAADVPCVDYNISMIATAPKQALTSASNSWGAYVTEAVKHVLDRTKIPINWCKGSSNGAVLITELNKTVVTPGTKEKVGEVGLKLAFGELHVFDTPAWTQDGKILDTYKKDGSDVEYISDGYFHESKFALAPAFDILIDGIKTIDN